MKGFWGEGVGGSSKWMWRWWLRKVSPLAIFNDDGFEISNRGYNLK